MIKVLPAVQSTLKGYGLFSYSRYATNFSDRPTAYLNLFLQISITYFHLRKDSLLAGPLLDRSFALSSFAAGSTFTLFALQELLTIDRFIPDSFVAPLEYTAKKISFIVDTMLVLHIAMEVIFQQNVYAAFMAAPLLTSRLKVVLGSFDETITKITWWLVFPYHLGVPGAIWQATRLF